MTDSSAATGRNHAGPRGSAGQGVAHESAAKHVSGEAIYIDDMMAPKGTLHAYVGLSTIAHGVVNEMSLAAVKNAPGVVDVITRDDIPGITDIGPVFPGDPLMVGLGDTVEFHGQVLFAVAATSYAAARKAAQLAKIEYSPLPACLSIEDGLAAKSFVRPAHFQRRGDAERGLENAAHRMQGELQIGGQEQMYLEGQASLCVPEEDGGMLVYSSTQNPTEGQKLVAEVLGVDFHQVTVDTRRMGGAFGGKETHANQWACLAAILARRTGRAVKLRLARADDMRATGKRHHFLSRYDVGFDDEGQIQALDLMLAGGCGMSPDLSDAIVDRAMFHCDNAYYLPDVAVAGHRVKTHTVSNTAFRGFGGPQGMVAIEDIIDAIARKTGMDPLDVRKKNLYTSAGGRDVTHYGQTIEQHVLPQIIERLEQTSDYHARREAIRAFNADSTVIKKGLALTPVKFGISFTAKHLNQAGALIHVYTDGSIQLNHGGTEMGQGLYTKVAQVVARELQVDIACIRCTATRTDKVPNTSPTAASSGSDINGMAALNAARKIRYRLTKFACEHFDVSEDAVVFAPNEVQVGAQSFTFAELVNLAYHQRISLSATGFYRTPKIHYDRATATGRPFYYYANGACVSEVQVDTLTGEYRVERVDICHDVGNSLNPAIDIGQIEGGFIQGMGWLTNEELAWDDAGRLSTTGPATYKIPAIGDTPAIFNVELLPDSPNAEATIFRSKAVGEPPLMLAISVWSAIRDAVASLGNYRVHPKLDTPATPERVLLACESLRKSARERIE
ncbi:xanthine dehydrogenase molybdopterin binding subunit [Congregibacter litoralis]|uniref:Xanthine dehydrogenase, molybdenum binding protein subunit apoprotein n=1 Tax=Congregibacter litoralis KT71 TaxID=314285 RepID=A4A376_9GAMM|nr:xanthine dehydrogenase molybdopterin binding subunit [Congregibacter litoralis]EAQ99149.1 xanthine dehydrogenase, molybdenum binding protein subunit apoprotein [Congregibacter litoralis KT71]